MVQESQHHMMDRQNVSEFNELMPWTRQPTTDQAEPFPAVQSCPPPQFSGLIQQRHYDASAFNQYHHPPLHHMVGPFPQQRQLPPPFLRQQSTPFLDHHMTPTQSPTNTVGFRPVIIVKPRTAPSHLVSSPSTLYSPSSYAQHPAVEDRCHQPRFNHAIDATAQLVTRRRQSSAPSISQQPIPPAASDRQVPQGPNKNDVMATVTAGSSQQHRPDASTQLVHSPTVSVATTMEAMSASSGNNSISTTPSRKRSQSSMTESERSRMRRRLETPSQRQARLAKDRERMRRRRAEEDERLKAALDGVLENSEQVAKQILETRRRRKEMAKRRLENESAEQRSRRLKRQREHKRRAELRKKAKAT